MEDPTEVFQLAGWKEKLRAAIERLNRKYFVVEVGNKARVAGIRHDLITRREYLSFMGDHDIRVLYDSQTYIVGLNKKGEPVFKGLGSEWLVNWKRRWYERMEMITSGYCPPEIYNLWQGFSVEPKTGEWPTIKDHIFTVICSSNKSDYDWLLKWLARCVQLPGERAEVAVVLMGLRGIGKGQFVELLSRIFGSHFLSVHSSKHLVGSFNRHLMDLLFLYADEAVWGGDKQGESSLKALITEDAVMIEPKGIDAFPVPNRLKIVIASNSEWVIPAGLRDERRFFALNVSECHRGDPAYFNRLAKAAAGPELAAFFAHLLQLDLAGFEHRYPPHTKALNEQKLVGAETQQKFWHDCIYTGSVPHLEGGGDDWPDFVRCSHLYDAYVAYARLHGDLRPVTEEMFGRKLREMLPGLYLGRTRNRDQDGRPGPRKYVLPTLPLCREAWGRFTGD